MTKVWVLGGQGLVGQAMQRQAPADTVFLGRSDFELGAKFNLKIRAGDVVVDLIPPALPRSEQGLSPDEYHQKYTRPHEELIRTITALGARYVFMSSGGTVYGLHPGRVHRETDTTTPLSLYGASKLRLEEVVAQASSYAILRPANIFCTSGQTEKVKSVVNIVLRKITQGETVDIFGDLRIAKDYVSDRDVATATILACNARLNGVFNIGSGKATSLGELIAAMELVAKKKARIQYHPAFPNDVTYFCLDPQKARRDLGFSAKDDVLTWIAASPASPSSP